MNRLYAPLCAFLFLAAVTHRAQAQDSTRTELAPVKVTVTRDVARPTLDLPFALTRVDVATTREGTRRASLTELLYGIPGVVVSNRYNPTQDPRLAVRGFGARSAFGIRGVRILRDGIPLTLPDGQTAVDFLDLETISAAEVMRGSAGALYGNASGGVIDFRSPPPPSSGSRGQFRTFTADGIVRGSLYGGAATPLGQWQGTLSRTYGDGPRRYSSFSAVSAFLDGRWSLGGTRVQAQVTRYDAPLAENPGALTAIELDTAFTAADPQNITKRSSKSVRQTLISLSAQRAHAWGDWSASVFGGSRDLENPQSFAIVAFERASYGASLKGQYQVRSHLPVRLTGGVDLLSQTDDRQNWTNCAGLSGTQRPVSSCPTSDDRGRITLDQRERVASAGMYLRAEAQVRTNAALSAGMRWDRTRFAVADHRSVLSGVTIAPSRSMGALTPMIGFNWRPLSLASFYINYAESFETPTTTELANQPDGSGGLNRELRPQHGRTFEAGAKGVWRSRVRYDVAVYGVRTTDELIPFEIPNSNGRRYFRNAGATSRRGAEVGVSGDAGPMTLGGSWSAIRYVYDEYVVTSTSYDGNRVPGVAPVTWTGFLSGRSKWGTAALEWQHAARTAADDANVNYADGYTLLNARAELRLGRRYGLAPSLGVDNLFDRHYAANIVTNAGRGRFYEPGAGRTVWLGLQLSFDRLASSP